MKTLTALFLSIMTIGCTTTRYTAQNGNPNFSFEKMPEQYRHVRRAQIKEWESYYLFGLVSGRERQDLGQLIPLSEGERCVNLEITNSVGPAQGAAAFLLGMMTAGISILVWQPRQTEIVCDIVAPNQTPATAMN